MSDSPIQPMAFIHPTAVVDAGAVIGPGAKVWHFVHVSSGARIGEGTSLGQNTFVGRGVVVGDRVKVQNNVSIYEGVTVEDDVFLGPSCVFTNVNTPRAFAARMDERGDTRVGRGATIGANATIVCGHSIGEYAFVGAGAVVTRDVPPHALVVGNPARRVGWVSRAGRRLPDGAEVCCPETGERYLIDEGSCRPVDSGSGLRSPVPVSVPFVDLTALHAPVLDDLRAAFERVVASGTFILGEEVAAFEREVAATLGVAHAVGVSSGSDALLAAMMALEIGPGDEVITTPFSFFATVGAILRVGATPVFADIDPDTLLLDPREVARVAGPRTRAAITVHLFGRVCDVPAIRAALEQAAPRAAIVEDAAQAFGASLGGTPAGALGDIGCFSFFPTKVLGALGDAGLVTTADAALSARVRRIRTHGAEPRYHHVELGGNFRLDALQAAFLRAKLPHAASWRAARQAVARHYREALSAAGLIGLMAPGREDPGSGASHPSVQLLRADEPGHGASQLAVRVTDRDRVRAALADRGIATEVYYPAPLHRQPVLTQRGVGEASCPHAAAAAASILCLPLRPGMTDADVDRVVAALADAVRADARPPT